uniref:Uncharacterized protein n=1 Tax=Anopheles melas TaxID=34690 RepID=A0A182TPV4_9DIPT
MVSPSKAKLSRIAGQQQQQQQQQQEQQEEQQHRPSQASQRKANNKVQLVKGPKPLVYHRFYLDIEQHQIATKIETTIKQLGGVSMKNNCPLLYSSLTVRELSIRPETGKSQTHRHFPQNEEQTLTDRQKRGEREKDSPREKDSEKLY